MKAYPCENITTDYGEVYEIPTHEACANFLNYLDGQEKEFYLGLHEIDKLRLALSVNPFRAFKSLMEKNNGNR